MRWWAAVVLLFQGSPQEEYRAKLAQISKNTAAKHYALGDFLATAQMHLWAREQFNKTIELDADHEGGRKRLGYKKGENGWEFDATAKVDLGNKKKGEEAERVRKQFLEKYDSAGKDLSRQWTDLGLFCKRSGMASEAAAAFQKAVEYDPVNATARKELGFEKDAKGAWISKTERELRREMKEGLPKAPQGAVSEAATEVEKALGLKDRKRESAHFLIEAPHLSDAQLSALVQHAEHAYALYHKIFGQTELFEGQKMHMVVLKEKSQHLAFVDAFYKGTPAQKDLARKSMGTGGFPLNEQTQDTRPEAAVQDTVVHSTAEICSQLFTRGPYLWIHEGTAYYFTRLMKDTAATYCVDLAPSGPKNEGKSYQDAVNWPIVCKVWVREGKDPNIDEVVKCTNLAELSGAETVKAWSLVEYLIAEHRAKFIELCKALQEGLDIEKALKKVWGWTTTDLDHRWKAYVKVTY